MRSSLAQTPMRFCIPSIWPSLPRSSRKRCVLSRASRRSPGLLALSAVGGGQRKNSRVEIGTTVIDMRYDNPTQVRPRAIGGRNCCCNWAQRAELDVNFDESGKPSYIQQASLNRTLCCAWYGRGASRACPSGPQRREAPSLRTMPFDDGPCARIGHDLRRQT